MISSKVEDILTRASQNPLLLGIRHILDFEDANWLGREDVQHTLGVLEKLDLSYDLLLRQVHRVYIIIQSHFYQTKPDAT